MACVYRELRAMQAQAGERPFTASNADIANACNQRLGAGRISEASVACGVAVFRELGLIETRSTEGGDRLRAIHVVNTESKVELTDSVRYREGLPHRHSELRRPRQEMEYSLRRAAVPLAQKRGHAPAAEGVCVPGVRDLRRRL